MWPIIFWHESCTHIPTKISANSHSYAVNFLLMHSSVHQYRRLKILLSFYSTCNQINKLYFIDKSLYSNILVSLLEDCDEATRKAEILFIRPFVRELCTQPFQGGSLHLGWEALLSECVLVSWCAIHLKWLDLREVAQCQALGIPEVVCPLPYSSFTDVKMWEGRPITLPHHSYWDDVFPYVIIIYTHCIEGHLDLGQFLDRLNLITPQTWPREGSKMNVSSTPYAARVFSLPIE